MAFVWIPGTPPDQDAIERLKQHFPKPAEPPPQAWFMGDITYYDSVLDFEPAELDTQSLEWYFNDTSAGLRNFPEVQFAVTRWQDTFHYLLPHLIQRSHEGYLLSDLISYFIQIYPDTIPDIYPEFRSDILHTLGMAIMSPHFWNGGDLSAAIIQEERESWESVKENYFVTIISPALYFCLKYLTPPEVETWCESIFEIPGIHWHYHLMFWLYRETFSLLIRFEEDDLVATKSIYPEHGLGTNVDMYTIHLPSENVKTFMRMLKKHRIYYA